LTICGAEVYGSAVPPSVKIVEATWGLNSEKRNLVALIESDLTDG
jgi:hypothetical protein